MNALQVLSGKFRVTNVSESTRVLYTPDRKPVAIAKGQTVIMFLSESDEKYLIRSQLVRIEPAEDEDEPTVARSTTSPAPVVPFEEPAEDEPEKPKAPVYVAETAQELLTYIKENKDTYSKWMPTAKYILGEDWPTGVGGGMPKTAVITKLLRDRIKNEQ